MMSLGQGLWRKQKLEKEQQRVIYPRPRTSEACRAGTPKEHRNFLTHYFATKPRLVTSTVCT